MAIWVHRVTKEPGIHLGIYLDDRTLWARGNDAVSTIHRANLLAAGVDAAFGLTLHKDKGGTFSSHSHMRRLCRLLLAYIGSCTHVFVMLGIHYNSTKGHRVAKQPDTIKTMRRMLFRIKWPPPAHGPRNASFSPS